MNYDYADDGWDGLRLCVVCGDRETTDPNAVCWSCRQQDMIDNDDMSFLDAMPPSDAWDDDGNHFDTTMNEDWDDDVRPDGIW